MAKHTPLPWHSDQAPWMGEGFCVLYQGSVIAECREITRGADRRNAEYIVKCVNNHERLKAALQKMIDAEDCSRDAPGILFDAAQEADALLAEIDKGDE